MTLSDDEISKYEMKNYIQKMADESIFRHEILQLIIDDKIKIFLERIQDFTREDIPENHIQPLINVLMDMGDSIPNKYEGMFSISNHMQIMRIFHQLLSRFNDKSKRFIILNEAMTKAQHSINVMCQDISIQMQEHGEYEDEPKPDEQTTLTREMLSDLKEIFKSKVEYWGLKDSLFEHENGLSILYVWLKLDEFKVKNYVESAIVEDKQFLNFLMLFISYSYSQSSYTTQKHQKYDYEAIARFIDIEKIFSRLQTLEHLQNIDDNTKYAIENFKQAYNGQILEEQEVPNV
jgi:predicted KAP-like P-loop ATPase